MRVRANNASGGGGDVSGCDVLIPNMTSATSPSGTASTDSAVTGYEAYKGFNNSSTAGWYVNNASYATHYIQYKFPTAVTAKAVMVYIIQGSGSPTVTYTLRGSKDGSTWDILVSGATANNNASDYWTNVRKIDAPNSYQYYRWGFSASTTTTAAKGLKLNLLG